MTLSSSVEVTRYCVSLVFPKRCPILQK